MEHMEYACRRRRDAGQQQVGHYLVRSTVKWCSADANSTQKSRDMLCCGDSEY